MPFCVGDKGTVLSATDAAGPVYAELRPLPSSREAASPGSVGFPLPLAGRADDLPAKGPRREQRQGISEMRTDVDSMDDSFRLNVRKNENNP